ncbi:phosphoglycolate phosphatase [Morganella psychrotolerans]|uniref:phosphoglycolate phosphatase n=1 Tax=Morganella psychrotolerans TaxID=368603 RepID=UPI0039AFD92D
MTDKTAVPQFTGIKAVAFDLDGTLVDSIHGLADATDSALNELGYPQAGKENVTVWIGNGVDILLERALTWATGSAPDAALHAKCRQLFDEFYADAVKTGSPLFANVKPTLQALADAGMDLAIVTNKPTPFIAPLLAELGITDFFSVVLGGDDVKNKKPHPSPLYLTLGEFGLRREEMLFVGDSRNDILAAQAAECPSVGLTYGYNYGIPIADSHPDCVLSDFAGLLPALGLSPLTHQEG